MRTPVVLLTGVDPEAMATAMVSLQFDLPNAVAVRHRIRHLADDWSVLRRTVSDVTGVVERHEVELDHACVSCAIREDVLPTLERLAADGRWASIVAHLPLLREHGLALLAAIGGSTVLALVAGAGAFTLVARWTGQEDER